MPGARDRRRAAEPLGLAPDSRGAGGRSPSLSTRRSADCRLRSRITSAPPSSICCFRYRPPQLIQGIAPPHPGSPRPPRASTAAAESVGVPSRPRIATRLVSFSKPAPGSSASLTTMRSRSFRSSFARPLATRVSRLQREAHHDAARLPRLAGPAQDVLGGLHRNRQRAVHPGPLARAGIAGPEVGGRRGHHQHVGCRQLGSGPPLRARWCTRPAGASTPDRRAAEPPGPR